MRINPSATIDESLPGAEKASAEAMGALPAPKELVRTFDPASQRDWCELIRDLVAAANSGGGTLLVHNRPNRWPLGSPPRILTSLTTQVLIQRIREFTGSAFANVVAQPVERQDVHAVRIAVGPTLLPIGFTKNGTYLEPGEPARQVDVFPAGSFYFRHGDRSEPATEADLRVFFERLLRRVRRQWLRGIRNVVGTPTETLLQSGISPGRDLPIPTHHRSELQPVRIVEDPNAPALQPQDVDRLYPFRLKDVVAELNRQAGRRALTTYDIQAARRQHQLDARPDFVFHLFGAGRRYSPAMIEWLASRWQRDPEFFRAARQADQLVLRRRRQKPR